MRLLSLGCFIALSASAASAQQYDYTAIEFDYPLVSIHEVHIGGAGTITGLGEDADGNFLSFLVMDGEGMVLSEDIRLGGVNAEGAFVGASLSSEEAFLYDSRIVDTFSPLYGTHYGVGINDKGSTCGDASSKSGESRAWYSLSSGESGELSPLAGDRYSWSFDINNKDFAIGWSAADSTTRSAVLWDSDQNVYEMSTFSSAVQSIPTAINDSGLISGILLMDDASWHAVRWHYTDLERLASNGFTRTAAMDINDSGTIVGVGQDRDDRIYPLMWDEDGNLSDLSSFLPEGDTGYAAGINDDGVIVGVNGSELFTLTPTESLELPDLTVTLDEAIIGGSAYLLISVTNSGDVTADEVELDVFLGADTAPAMGSVGDTYYQIDQLSPGETSYHVTEAVSGTIYAVVDSMDHIEESNEDNNIASLDLD